MSSRVPPRAAVFQRRPDAGSGLTRPSPSPCGAARARLAHWDVVSTPFGVYVHVPFCAARCGYCDFNTYTPSELAGSGASPDGWLEAVRQDVSLAPSLGGARPGPPAVVGGRAGGRGLAGGRDAVAPGPPPPRLGARRRAHGVRAGPGRGGSHREHPGVYV